MKNPIYNGQSNVNLIKIISLCSKEIGFTRVKKSKQMYEFIG